MKPSNRAATTATTMTSQARTIKVAQTAEMQDNCGQNTVSSLQLRQTTFNMGED